MPVPAPGRKVPSEIPGSAPPGAPPVLLPPPRGAAWLVPPLLACFMAILRFAGSNASREAPLVLAILNLLFAATVGFLVAILAARTFLLRGRPGLLLLACGVLAYGASAAVGPLFIARDSNAALTVQGLSALIAAVCHFAGALSSARPGPALRHPALWLAAAVAGTLGLVALVCLGSLGGALPVFFRPGLGGTPVRFAVLGSASALFIAAALLLRTRDRRSPSAFLGWYAFALAILGTGFLGFMLQLNHGSILGWSARAATYLGGACMIAAAAASAAELRTWSIPLEEALKDSEARFLNLIDLLPDAVVLHGGGELIYFNDAALRLFGASSPEDLAGKTVLDVVHPEDRALVQGRIQSVADGQPISPPKELRILRLDGTHVWAEVRGIATQHGGRTCMLAVLRDVTERKREAELRLRRMELEAWAAALEARNEELARFTKLSVGRELRMVELKRAINTLSRLQGLPPPYPSALVEGPGPADPGRTEVTDAS